MLKRLIFILLLFVSGINSANADIAGGPSNPDVKKVVARTGYDPELVQVWFQQGHWWQAYRTLLPLEVRYSEVPSFNYDLGVAALKVGAYARAANALERAVLQQPRHAGAYLDLAIAFIMLKDYRSASERIDQLEQRFRLPPKIEQAILYYRKLIEDGKKPSTRWQRSINAMAGYNSNVNNGTDASLIEFISDNGSFQIPLSEDSKPQGDFFIDLGARFSVDRVHEASHWHGSVSAQLREYSKQNDFDTLTVFTGGGLSRNLRGDVWDFSLYHARVLLDDSLYQTAVMGIVRYSPTYDSLWNWQWQYRFSDEKYDELDDQDNDAKIHDLNVVISHPLNGLSLFKRLGFSLSYSFDQSLNNRAGGDQQSWEAETFVDSPLNSGLLRTSLSFQREEDSSPYSPSFGSTIRKTDKFLLKSRYQRQLDENLDWELEARVQVNSSNLELFDTTSAELRSRISYRF
ncbi:M48 family metallopeptidase [Motiliproteus sp. MSK22-1]|uniref:tetratricopeptide repeat protein n=1 Tax=Motiliproteus sp. MSK22-1 TaxID=1897630 RepID=UPI00097689B0|nr:tetratricopeptide repeat protein [Motiliproteus sp. MSK22-1]OMH30390.1 hypothetical protein BGP75_18610 [Motiliproteus sp. MSK22-1]